MKVQSKDFKDKNKKGNFWDKIEQKFNLSAGEAGAKFRNIRTAYGRYRIQNRCFRRFWSRFMTNRRSKFACSKFSAPPRSRCCLLHARLTFLLTKTYGYGRLCDQPFLRSSAICDLRSSAIIWKPALRLNTEIQYGHHRERGMLFISIRVPWMREGRHEIRLRSD